jgi:hypothetical protein
MQTAAQDQAQEDARITRAIAATKLQREMRNFAQAGATDEQIVQTLEMLGHEASTNRSFMQGIRQQEPEATRDLRAERWLLEAAKRVGRGQPGGRYGQQHVHEEWRRHARYRSGSLDGTPEQFGGPPVDGRATIVTLAKHIDALRLAGQIRGAEAAFQAVADLLEKALEGA